MRRFHAGLVCLSAAAFAVAQVTVTGKVIEKGNNEAVAGASVIIKGSDGKIKKFANSKTDGTFEMAVPSIDSCTLNVSMMGFARQEIPLDTTMFPLTVYLEEGSTLLKEVNVKADRIREQGDTITYNVGSFAQSQDRSIGDVLNRMPGISVENSGKIQYQGEDINKFYIEGSDLMGGRYGVATNGISHEDVGAVEIMENHQPLQVLSGLSYSDKAAINLKLKNKAKATWTFSGAASAGYCQQPQEALWRGRFFAMAVMPGFHSITTILANNIGKDLESMTRDFLTPGRETDLSPYIGLALPGVPNLNRSRTLFNRSLLVSTNNLWKFKTGEFKAQIDYTFNRTHSEAANITTYYLNDGDKVITEQRDGTDRKHTLSGKFIYELNQKTAFINNTLMTELSWDDIDLSTTGTLPNTQSASLPDYYVSNNFKMIKRFGGKHLVTFKSVNEWESLPQTLAMNPGGNSFRQQVRDHAFVTNESAAYTFALNGFTIGLEGGIKGYFRSMRSDLSDLSDPSDLSDLSDQLHNVINTNYLTLYVTPKFEYWIKRVNFTLNAPVSFAHYSFDKELANRNECYFSPALSVNWKPNNNFSTVFRGGLGRSPMSLNMIQPGLIMTDYRSFRSGVDDFYTSSSKNLGLSLYYKQPRSGLFANASLSQAWGRMPYTMVQQLFGDYIVYSYSDAKSDNDMFRASCSFGKSLDFMRGTAKLNGSFARNKSNLISENQEVNSTGTSWTAGFSLNGSPLKWLSFDYRINYSSTTLKMNGAKTPWLSGMQNELMINILPHKKWEWTIGGEHYRNEIEKDLYKNVFLVDTKLTYMLNKHLEFSAALSNLFNKKTYDYTSYNQLSSFESRRWLRGREFLISVELHK